MSYRFTFDNAKEECPHCGAKNFAKRLTPEDKYNSYVCYPETIYFRCLFCGKKYYKTIGGIRVLSGEEAVRKRPKMYIGHPEWGELAEKLLEERKT